MGTERQCRRGRSQRQTWEKWKTVFLLEDQMHYNERAGLAKPSNQLGFKNTRLKVQMFLSRLYLIVRFRSVQLNIYKMASWLETPHKTPVLTGEWDIVCCLATKYTLHFMFIEEIQETRMTKESPPPPQIDSSLTWRRLWGRKGWRNDWPRCRR